MCRAFYCMGLPYGRFLHGLFLARFTVLRNNCIMITIAIANHKGGVGKTATAHALGAGLAANGRKVLMVDIDPQGSLTAACGVNDANGESLANVIGGAAAGELAITEILQDVGTDETAVLHLAPADIQLSVNELGLVQRMGRENVLTNALKPVTGFYDICLIDCPPSLGMLTINALTAARYVIVPTQPQISDLRGLRLFLDTVASIRQQLNPHLEILGVLVTFYDDRLIHHNDALNVMQGNLKLFETRIGRSIRVAEAANNEQSIITYEPGNKQAENYRQFANEVDIWLRK